MSNEKLDDFIVEIGVEDVPHHAINKIREDLKEIFCRKLEQNGVAFNEGRAYSTPRRFILFFPSLPSKTKEKRIERKGMPFSKAYDGKKWTPMGLGFLKTLGLDESFSKDELRDYEKGLEGENHNGLYLLEEKGTQFLYVSKKVESVETESILAEMVKQTIEDVSFDVAMRWADVSFSFIRPIQYIVCFFGKKNISIDFHGALSAAKTRAHRQIHRDEWLSVSADDYFKSLTEHHVIYDQDKRRSMIVDGLKKAEKDFGVKVVENPLLLEDLVNLVEYPNVLVCDFEEDFLKLPKELLISQMVKNQYYFPCEDPSSGRLKNKFLVVCNVEDAAYTKKGYERVLRARLNDGLFLYEEDVKTTLESMQTSQEQVEFLKGATYLEKIQRVERLLEVLAKSLKNETYLASINNIQASRLTRLYKADLSSKVVYEFPELQGIMGGYYSEKDHGNFVSQAIRESYLPLNMKGALPKSRQGLILSLCDKTVNLSFCFEKNLIPTGSGDPFGLRRDAFAIIRILVDGSISFNFIEVLEKLGVSPKTSSEIWIFVKGRLKKFLEESEFQEDESAFLMSSSFTDIARIVSLGRAVKDLKNDEMFKQFLALVKRIKNILPKDALLMKKNLPLREDVLENDHESVKKVYQFILDNEEPIMKSMDLSHYKEAFYRFASIKTLLDEMFDKVVIEDENVLLKENRRAILIKLQNLIDIGDFSLLL